MEKRNEEKEQKVFGGQKDMERTGREIHFMRMLRSKDQKAEKEGKPFLRMLKSSKNDQVKR